MRNVELQYRAEERAPSQTVLEEDDSAFRLTFRMMPAWAAWLPVAVCLAMAAMYAGGVLLLIRVAARWGTPTQIPWTAWAIFAGLITTFLTTAAVSWRSLWLYGHLPRVLMIDQARGVLRHRAERSWRWREWPRRRVKRAEVREVSMLGWLAAVRLVIEIEGRLWPMQATVRASERPAVEAFAQRINEWVKPTSTTIP
jgi:hypothetical protein